MSSAAPFDRLPSSLHFQVLPSKPHIMANLAGKVPPTHSMVFKPSHPANVPAPSLDLVFIPGDENGSANMGFLVQQELLIPSLLRKKAF